MANMPNFHQFGGRSTTSLAQAVNRAMNEYNDWATTTNRDHSDPIINTVYADNIYQATVVVVY